MYDALEQDPLTKRAIAEIEALKSGSPDSPPAFACDEASPSPSAAVETPIDGTWQHIRHEGRAPGRHPRSEAGRRRPRV